MLLDANKAVIRNGIDAINEHKDLSIIDAFVAPDYIDHTNQLTWEDVKRFYTLVLAGLPDYHRTVEAILAEGDKVWVHSTTTGTHPGEFRGVAPTGKTVVMPGANIYRLVDGKMVDGWSVTDPSHLLTQLGLIEYTERGKRLLARVATPLPQSGIMTRTGGRSPSLDANKAIVRSLYDADNARDWTLLDELVSPNFMDASLSLRGPDAYRRFVTEFYSGFPDWQETMLDIAAEGDRVCVYLKGTGTHAGEFWGLPPTDETITIMMVQMWRVVDGKVVAKRSVADEVDAYARVGVIEYMTQGCRLIPQDHSE